MKKKIAVVLTALMMLSCSTMFLAAESIDTNVTVSGVVASDGKTYEVEVKNDATTLENNKAEAIKRAEMNNADVVAMVCLEGTIPAGTSLDITVDVVSAVKGDVYKVEHLKSSDNKWETLDAVSPADGKVTIKGVTEFSPFYIAKVDTTATNAGGQIWGSHEIPTTDTTTTTDATTLPKTGVPVVLPFAAVACVAGAVVCGRKAK